MILTLASYRRAFGRLSEEQNLVVENAVARIEPAFGASHRRSGSGIRPFGKYFEARAGLALRILFTAQKHDIILVTVGNHNEIRTL